MYDHLNDANLDDCMKGEFVSARRALVASIDWRAQGEPEQAEALRAKFKARLRSARALAGELARRQGVAE